MFAVVVVAASVLQTIIFTLYCAIGAARAQKKTGFRFCVRNEIQISEKKHCGGVDVGGGGDGLWNSVMK